MGGEGGREHHVRRDVTQQIDLLIDLICSRDVIVLRQKVAPVIF